MRKKRESKESFFYFSRSYDCRISASGRNNNNIKGKRVLQAFFHFSSCRTHTKKMFLSSIFLLIISSTIVYSFPCPRECICKPTDIIDMGFTRMFYLIDCSNVSLNNDQLVYQAEQWSINQDKLDRGDDSDEDGYSTNDYAISIDLSNSLSLKNFSKKTIQLTGFSFFIQNLSLSNQANKITLNPNSFDLSIYENLQILNLSSCCKQIPKQCQQLFRPLNKLEILDLSGSDMYKTCLNTPGMLSYRR